VAVQTYAEFLKNFFERERKNLLENYPGLTLHRLSKESPIADLDDVYFPSRSNVFTQFIAKIKNGIPLEYISGSAYFYRSYFTVDETVLIPRNETEILVELATQKIQCDFKNIKCKVLDICTGSGAIGLSLLREGGAILSMTLSDLSDEALDIAKTNYFQMQFLFSPQHEVKFVKSDRFKNISEKFDIILSNPPYIKAEADKDFVHKQVTKFEPSMALFIKDSDYDKWFHEFFCEIFSHLETGGFAIIEGHENHLEELKSRALEIGFNKIDIIKDYNQCNRFLRLVK
jgi:release factor glutamine methyltransferase